MKIIILAGGIGTRLWPLSTENKPKQFCSFLGAPSFFMQAIQRALLLVEAKDIIVVASTCHKQIVEDQSAKGIKIVYEEERRNTLGAICHGIKELTGDEVILVLSSDHYISEDREFISACKKAEDQAKQGYFCVFGKKPTKPHTGYGYIQVSLENEVGFAVTKFVEKPDLKTAQSYLEDGRYFWNLGMFCFLKSIFEHKLKIHQPLWFEYIMNQTKVPKISISIDCGILEKAQGIFMISMDKVTWSDVGSFDALFELSNKTAEKNAIVGRALMQNARGNFVHLEDIELVCIDMEDLVMVQKGNKFLICPIKSAQKIKEIAIELETAATNPK